MTKITINGRVAPDYVSELSEERKEQDGINEIISIDSIRRYEFVDAARDASNILDIEFAEDEIIEIIYEDGIIDFLTKEDLQVKAKDPDLQGFEIFRKRDTGEETIFIRT